MDKGKLKTAETKGQKKNEFQYFHCKEQSRRQNNRQGLLSPDGATSGHHLWREGRQTEAITLLTVETGLWEIWLFPPFCPDVSEGRVGSFSSAGQ